MKKKIIITFLLGFNLLLAWVVKDNLENLVNNSPIIIIGKTINNEAFIEYESNQRKVYTCFDIQVDSILYGNLNKINIKICQIGGKVGNIGTWSELV